MNNEFGYTGSEYSNGRELHEPHDPLNHIAPEINEGRDEYWCAPVEYTESLQKETPSASTAPQKQHSKDLHKKVVRKMVYAVASAVTVVSLAQVATPSEDQSLITNFENVLDQLVSTTATPAPQEPLLAAQTIVFSGSGILTKEAVENELKKYDLSENFAVIIEDGYTEIAAEAFSNRSTLVNVSIPDSVTVIGDKVFSECKNLVIDTLDTSGRTIGTFAFQDVTIKDVIISDTFNCVQDHMYPSLALANIQNISFEQGITFIPAYALSRCSTITSVDIPDTVTSIGTEAFNECTALTDITIPDNVTTIESDAFRGCSNLIIDSLSTSGRTIGTFAFREVTIKDVIISDTFNCAQSHMYPSLALANIQNISFEQGITFIPAYALSRCSTITSVDIPDTVTSIGADAFYECTALTDITLPDNVTTIESNAFRGCSNLILDVLNTSGRTIGTFAFQDVTIKDVIISDTFNCAQSHTYPSLTYANIQNISFEQGITFIPAYALSRCSTITSVDIPDTVTSIGADAFYECTALTDVTIPNSVTTIEEESFAECPNLTLRVSVGSAAEAYALEKNIPYVTN